MHKYISRGKIVYFAVFLFLFSLGIHSAISAPSQSLANRLKGYILLQVEENGEAWYVIPTEQKMVYLQNGAVAYQVMRELSLGITDANLAKIPVGVESRFNDVDTDGDGLADRLEEGLATDLKKADTDGDGFSDGEEIKNNYNPLNNQSLNYDTALVDRLRGYILLQVEKQGQAWYLNPKDGKRYYMQDGPAAYNIMRFLSLGITNANLKLIPKSERTFDVNTTPPGNSNNTQGNNNSTSTPPSTPPNTPPGGGGGGGGGGIRPPTPNNDQDNDGYIASNRGGNDCNDSNPSINPGSTEICGNNVDEDCSGTDLQCVVPDYDQDNDGYDSTQHGGTDCNDSNPSINPGVIEILGNNIDDNCNAQTDETTTPIADTQNPTNPTNLSGTTSGTQVILTWSQSTDNVGVYQYDVERQVSTITGYQNIASVNASTYTNIDLENGGTYTYRVKARDLVGNTSGYSNIFTITTNAAPDTSAPSTPTNLTAVASTLNTHISLTWADSTDNIGVYQYHIERSTDNSTFSEIATFNKTGYIDSQVNGGTTYYYRVRARDAALNYSLNFSNVASATAVAIVIPPSGNVSITGVSGTMSQGQTITISGSGFGTKNRQQPLMFDNLVQTTGYQGYLQNNTIVPTRGCIENSTSCEVNPQPTNQSLPWYNHWYGGTPRFYVGSSSRYASHPAYRATNLANADSRKGYFARDFSVNTAEGWTNLDWWIRSNLPFGEGPGGGVSGKILRLWHNPNLVDQLVAVNMPNPVLYADRGCTVHTDPDMEYFASYTLNQWSHVSMLTKVSPSGTEARFLVNGELAATVTGFCGNGGIYDYLRMVGIDPSYPEYLDPNLEFLWGDIYFDDSLARAVLSDSPTFNPFGGSSTNHYEVQNIQSWSNNSVTFKANPGSFTSGQTVYLYVVDSNGSVNANGYPVTIAGTSVVDQTAPTTPTNLSATISGTQVSLSWTGSTDATGVTGYQILRSTTTGGPYTQQTTSNTTSYTQSGLTNGTTYYYVVKAYDAAGNYSSSSNQITVQIAASNDSCTPIAITNLTSNIGTSNPQNTASVTATTGSVMYLTVGLAFMPVSFPTDSITISGLGATWTKISTNTFGYRRRVWLFKGVGASGTGPVTINYTGANASSFHEIGWVLDKATGLDLTTPNDNVVTTETAYTSPNSLTVSTSGTPGTCDVTYSSLVLENQQTTNVESGWASLGQTSRGSLGVRKVASAWDDARDTSHTWSWSSGSYAAAFITILNNESGIQPPVSDQTAPTAPTNLNATVSGTQVSLNWTSAYDANGVARYLIETSNGGAYSQVGTSNSTSYTITSGLAANTTYSCRVQAEDAAGNMSLYSNVATVTTSGTTPPSGSVNISGVNDDTVSHGQSITISGSGFGTKVSVGGVVGPPVLWDNFEDGTNGQLVQTSSAKWDRVRSDNTSGPRYYAGAIDGSMGVRTGSGIVDGVTAGNTRVLIEDDEFRNLYLDYYIRAYKGQGLKQRSNKQVMIWSANAGVSEDGPNTAFWQITQGGEEPPFTFSEYSCVNEPFSITYGNGWGVDEFTTARHVQIEYRRPSIIGVDNGHLRMWYDGVLVSDDASFGSYACDPDRNYLDNLYIGHYQDVDSAIEPQWKWISCPGDSRCDQCPVGASGCSVNNDAWLPARQDEFFYDNIYIDKSIARVEIGNASTYAASTRREVQIPNSWGNTIQITFNKGGFSSGQTVYLYVIDSNGNVNSSGYPITISGVLGTNVSSCNTPDQETVNWTQIPNGTLVRGCGSAIYVIQNNRRVHINSLDVLRNQYPGQRIYNVREALLLTYPIL